MRERLAQAGVECEEVPLIEHADAEGADALPGTLREREFDWVVVTSPEVRPRPAHGSSLARYRSTLRADAHALAHSREGRARARARLG